MGGAGERLTPILSPARCFASQSITASMGRGSRRSSKRRSSTELTRQHQMRCPCWRKLITHLTFFVARVFLFMRRTTANDHIPRSGNFRSQITFLLVVAGALKSQFISIYLEKSRKIVKKTWEHPRRSVWPADETNPSRVISGGGGGGGIETPRPMFGIRWWGTC